jgi:diguanylate cyclase (GGDEF)-like protein
MSAWVWDEGEQEFQLAATAGAGSLHGAKLDALRLNARETPAVRNIVKARRPMRFDAETADPFIRAVMENLGLAAIVSVPIIAREELLGLLIVSVGDHAERLRMTQELLQRLQGVAAQAATALQNGRLVDELDRRATHDDLTGVLNRAGFGARMRRVLDDAGGDERVGLLFVDLDGFKPVNDEHGHDTGDELLRQVAARLRGMLRRDDIVARLGGDEFALVLARVQTDDETAAAARRVRRALSEPFVIGGRELRIGASVGTARWPDDGATVEALMRCADGEMYARKAARGAR